MAKLTLTRGLPGCGKTWFARGWVAQDPARRKRVNRDDLGVLLHGRRFYPDPKTATAEDHKLFQDTEKAISVAAQSMVAQLLQRGWDVIVDDTNLRRRFARELRDVALRNGAEFEIHDMTDVPLDVVLEQNNQRYGTPAFVPPAVIHDWAKKFTGKNAYALPLVDDAQESKVVERIYEPIPGTPKAIMVDIDGTVAIMGGRSPFDETRVHEDTPNHAVIEAVRAMHAAGYKVIFCSGRTDGCWEETFAWLANHVLPEQNIEALFMRRSKEDAGRKDSEVKIDLFNAHIRDNYDVLGVFDDRAQVVAAWRAIGLTVFAVAEGNF